ncbi:hypothetical protein [Bacteroides acidifaciens]|uniref:DUF6941 family protein n=1 Tax=Bacteroides acidifaciens TaxID=85831 RepID=UPI002578C28D|nr:hypothetical protein [Bacteroides acidifaciens]
MKTIIFTLCDYAQNVSGKITIVGTFNQICSDTFPFVYKANISFVAKLVSEKEILGTIECRIVDPFGNDITPIVKTSIEPAPKDSKTSTLDIVVNWNNLQFNIPGKYTVILSINDYFKETSELLIVENK